MTLKEKLYEYKHIADLGIADTNVNIFGIIKYFRQPSVTRNGQYNALYTVIDPSIGDDVEQGIRCNLFEYKAEFLPAVQNIGDIIRLHRVKVTEYNGRLQIQKTKGYSWVVYDCQQFDINKPKSSHPNPTITDKDKQRIQTLLTYSRQSNLNIENKITSLCDVALDTFFNCIVQVVAVCKLELESNHYLVKVSDGTRVEYNSFRQVGTVSLESTNLIEATKYCSFDISVFDDHVADVTDLQPGDFIHCTNVHGKSVSVSMLETCKDKLALQSIDKNKGWVELILHTGKHYGRGVKQIDKNDSRVISVKERISTLLDTHAKTAAAQQQGRLQDLPQSLQTALTTIDFPFQNFTSIVEIKKHKVVPYKFRLRAKIITFNPNKLSDIIIGMCNSCREYQKIDTHSTEKEYNSVCTKCEKDLLKVIYMFRLLVEDDTGLMEVNIYNKEALYFFNNIQPTQLLIDKDLLLNFDDKLQRLVNYKKEIDIDSFDASVLPWIELCVYSLVTKNGLEYFMFGTALI